VRITRVYTKAGDAGMTRLVGGQKVRKDDARIDSYGDVDELNAVIGMVRQEIHRSTWPVADREALDQELHGIQSDLFNLGSDLATRAADRWDGMRLVGEKDVLALEQSMDRMNEFLPPLEEFILPGGGPVSSVFHLARTVCRRAERRAVALAAAEEINPWSVTYLNRLSDWLFVAGRWAARASGVPEQRWDRTR
jgi:cob(I)alamin adenosyltransferase